MGEQHPNARWVLTAAILGSSMAFIDSTVINVALPVLQSALHARVDALQWVVDAYLLALSSLILAGGALGDRLGRRRVFGIGVLIFAAASLWCALAGTVTMLIIARAVQGVGAALLVPSSLAMISSAYPRDSRGRAIGTWSAMTSLSLIAGPLVGGFLVQHLSWRAAFLINLPIAAVVLALVSFKVPAMKAGESHRIDWLGTAMITIALGGVVVALIEAPSRGWRHPLVLAAAATGLVAFALFIVLEKRAQDPIVPLSLFRSPAFTGTNFLTLLLYASMSAVMFLLPFNLIQIQGYSPSQTGAAFLPFMVTMFLLSRWTGTLVDRVGPRIPLIVGPLTVAGGTVLLALLRNGDSYWTSYFPGILVTGLGMSITVAPLTTTVMTSVKSDRYAGTASGINNAVARAAGLLAIALFGALAIVFFSDSLDKRLQSIGAPPNVRRALHAERFNLAATKVPPGVPAEQRERVANAIRDAYLIAFRNVTLVAAAVAAASAAGALAVSSRDAAA